MERGTAASSGKGDGVLYYTALYGTYVNWLVTSIAAVFGTAANSPITSAGHSGQPWQESFVAMGFLTVANREVAQQARKLGLEVEPLSMFTMKYEQLRPSCSASQAATRQNCVAAFLSSQLL
jgi:hypothetical protein